MTVTLYPLNNTSSLPRSIILHTPSYYILLSTFTLVTILDAVFKRNYKRYPSLNDISLSIMYPMLLPMVGFPSFLKLSNIPLYVHNTFSSFIWWTFLLFLYLYYCEYANFSKEASWLDRNQRKLQIWEHTWHRLVSWWHRGMCYCHSVVCFVWWWLFDYIPSANFKYGIN